MRSLLRALVAPAGLVAGLLCLAPTSARAQAGGDISAEIKSLAITRVDGTEVELQLGLFKPGREAQYPVEVYFVNGAQRRKVWDGNARFHGQRGGNRHAATVNLRGVQNIERGELEAVVPGCAARATCKKKVGLGKGDLSFKRHIIERQGSESQFVAEVQNQGFTASQRCKLEFKLEGRKVGEKDVPVLQQGRNTQIKFAYPANKSGKPFAARLKCTDLSETNNLLEGRTR